jgi:hypothetical protein
MSPRAWVFSLAAGAALWAALIASLWLVVTAVTA